MAKSPVPKRKKTFDAVLTFRDAITPLLAGHKLTKREWDNPKTYIFMRDGKLCIHHGREAEDVFHVLIVSEGDMMGEDWQILTDTVKRPN
jgi:hypothetical protein